MISGYDYDYILYIYISIFFRCLADICDGSPPATRRRGGYSKPWPGGSRGLPGPRPPRHMKWLPAAAALAGAAAAAGGHSVEPASPTTPPIGARCMPAACVRHASTVSCEVYCVVKRGERAGQGGSGRVRACDMRATCRQSVLRSVLRSVEREKGRGGRGRKGGSRGPQAAGRCGRNQGAWEWQGEGGVGGVPRVLLREVYAGRVKGGRGQGHRGPGTKGPGKGGTKGQGRASRQGAGQGQGARAERGGKRGSAATRIAPHCARAGRRAERQRRQGREEGVPRRHEGASVGRKHKGAPQPSEPPAVRGGTGQGRAPRRAAARRSTPMGAVLCVE